MSEDCREPLCDGDDWVSPEEFMQAGKYWMALFDLSLTKILEGDFN